jgi:ABC-type amino acid transport substrate-binding protein
MTILPFKLIAAIGCAILYMSHARAADLVLIQQEDMQTTAKRLPSSYDFQAEVGKLLARQMGRTLVMKYLPRKRYAVALEDGEADLVCGLLPVWMQGDFDWSIPFIPAADVVLSAARVSPPKAIKDLKGKRIGTILGYSYPEVQQALGTAFVRDDTRTAESQLRMLAAGRFDYMITGLSFYAYRKKAGTLLLALNPPLTIAEYNTECAVSRKGHFTVHELNEAVETLLKGSELPTLLERYRPE